MPRCHPHRQTEPCHYCEKGIGKFESDATWIEALQRRVSILERAVYTNVPTLPEDMPKIQESIGVIRDFALGDLVMLAPALKALKAKNPGVPLVFLTTPSLFEVLAGAEYVDAQLPKHGYENAEFLQTFDLSYAVEVEAGGKLPKEKYLSQSRPDIFAELLGVEGKAEKFPIPVNHLALSKLRAILLGAKRPLIGLAPTCGSVVRTMPPEYVEPLAQQLLASYGGTVVLMGKTREYNGGLSDLRVPGVINLINTLSVAELIAACSLMDAMISPDTGTMHVAGALGVKCLCVMGNNDPKIFSNFYQSVKTIQATELKCVPCHDISIPCTPLPKGQAGAACMQAMTPERILGEFKQFYNGKNIAYLHSTLLSYPGGAEITTKGMIKAGRERGYNIRLFDKETPDEQFYSLYGYDLIILSNLWRFSQAQMGIIMQIIKDVPYVKYEHDFDGLREYALNNVGEFPREQYAEPIYRGAALNIFVSPAHQKDYLEGFPGIKTTVIPELLDLEMFQPVKGVKRIKDSCLIAVPVKWAAGTVDDYILKHPELKVTYPGNRVPFEDMPALYSQHEYLAHFPRDKWPCDRVIFEAALCGCKIDAGEIVKALSWKKDLTDQKGLRKWLGEVPGQFWKTIEELL